ncbi:MAG: hydrogenase maturation nickel metallochaperone HypA [Fimbriimonadales bacterium]|nr:hydrogenase maturation nickel metallochaperone HypA [Fimbriimonadales bacterium]
MHEVSICAAAVRAAVAKAEEMGGRRIAVLRLRIGALAGVVPEALDFAYPVVCRGTLAEGSRLELEHVPVRCLCEPCGKEFSPQGAVYACPSCGVPSARIVSGRELELAQIELE